MRPTLIAPTTLAFAALLLGLGILAQSGESGTGTMAGDPVKGKKLFSTRCVACHKPDGSGGIKVTGPATPDWRDAKLMAQPSHSDSVLRDCITNGRIKSGMVPWSKQGLKAADVEHLIAYVRTFSAPKASAKSTP